MRRGGVRGGVGCGEGIGVRVGVVWGEGVGVRGGVVWGEEGWGGVLRWSGR